jgi:hypothetical protein
MDNVSARFLSWRRGAFSAGQFSKLTPLLIGMVLVAVGAVTFIPTKQTRLSAVSQRHITLKQVLFVSSDGTELPAFFAGLSPDERWRQSINRKVRQGTGCQSSDSNRSPFAALFGGVVHAQPTCESEPGCSNCPGSLVDSITCEDCSDTDGNNTQWYEDAVLSGHKTSPNPSCMDQCCLQLECSCVD